MMSTRALRDLQANYAGLARAQEQVAARASSTARPTIPAQARVAVKVRDSLNALGQHLRNIDTAERYTSTAETALSTAGDIVVRLKELALQAANGTVAPRIDRRWRYEVAQLGELARRARQREERRGLRVQRPAHADARIRGRRGRLRGRRRPAQRPHRAGRDRSRSTSPPTSRSGRRSRRSWPLQGELTAGTPPVAARPSPPSTPASRRRARRPGADRLGGQPARLDPHVRRVFAVCRRPKLLSDLEDADMAEVISSAAQRQAVYEAALSVNARILRRSLVDEL